MECYGGKVTFKLFTGFSIIVNKSLIFFFINEIVLIKDLTEGVVNYSEPPSSLLIGRTKNQENPHSGNYKSWPRFETPNSLVGIRSIIA